jgi:hypothetical protein
VGAGLATFGLGRGVGATGRNDGTGVGRLKDGAGRAGCCCGAGWPPPLPIWAGVSPGIADTPIATTVAVNVIPRMG